MKSTDLHETLRIVRKLEGDLIHHVFVTALAQKLIRQVTVDSLFQETAEMFIHVIDNMVKLACTKYIILSLDLDLLPAETFMLNLYNYLWFVITFVKPYFQIDIFETITLGHSTIVDPTNESDLTFTS
jgi:hypothetical protein